MIYINGRFLTQNLTGVQRFAEEISLQLQQIRDDVIFLVPDLSAIKKKELLELIKIEEVRGFKGHLWEQISLPFYLFKKKCPLLINLGNTAPVIYPRQIVTHHDVTYLKYPKSFPLSFRLLYRVIAPLIIRNSKQVITVSEFSKSEIVSCYNCPEDKITIIPNAVSDIFKPASECSSSSEQGNYFLAVSSTNYHKNFHGLVEAFIASNINIPLKIIGSNAGVFSKLNYGCNHTLIDFVGRVDDEELVKLYQNAKAFVFPSFYEGFGIPPLEAQACRCPVISSNAASMPEVLGDSVIYFDPESKVGLIMALESINSDSGLREDLITEGIKNTERFSWSQSANILDGIVRKFNV